MSASFWEGQYQTARKMWGDSPTELAQPAENFIAETGLATAGKRLLDIGCGYGRDTLFLARKWDCSFLGADPSATAIAMAGEDAEKSGLKNIEFRLADFKDLAGETFDFVYASNLYSILPLPEREQFCAAVPRLLNPGGFFFLQTLSVRDPEHLGKGNPVPGDPDSYIVGKYIHLSSQRELEKNFRSLVLHRLYEFEFMEPRPTGEPHHHICWILIGGLPAG
jgi:cyclopropane fatty-acyl-phospholipid synthase-like methyltransferase